MCAREIQKLYAENSAALNAGEISALEAFYTEDAIQLPPNAPALMGREAIRASLIKELSGLTVQANIEVLETMVSENWAFARGIYRIVATPSESGQVWVTNGNWLDILRRQADGLWKISRSTWTTEDT